MLCFQIKKRIGSVTFLRKKYKTIKYKHVFFLENTNGMFDTVKNKNGKKNAKDFDSV